MPRCHIRVGRGRNCGVAAGIASPSISVQELFLLPVLWPPFCVPDVGQYRAMSTVPYLGRVMVENVGVAFEISCVVAIHAQVSCIYVDFKVFPVFWPTYCMSGMYQIWPEGTIL